MPTYNGETLTITLDAPVDGVLNMDWISVYSGWKDWLRAGSANNMRYPQAFRTTGGDPVNALLNSGAYWFLRNDLGWRIKPYESDGDYYVSGNLAAENSSLPMLIPTTGDYTVGIFGLQPITQGFSTTLAEGLEYNLFNDGVWIDAVNGEAGTTFPLGTPAFPCSNLTDAHTILHTKGLKKFFFLSDYTFTSSDILSDGYEFWGQGLQSTTFTFETGSSLLGSEIFNAKIAGPIAGIIGFTDCMLSGGELVSPAQFAGDIVVQNCLIGGTNVLPTLYSGDLYIIDCWAIPTLGVAPILDMNDCTGTIQIRNYSGFLTIKNCTESNDVRAFLNSGGITLDSTVTSGDFILTGTGTLTDNSTGTTINTDALISKDIMADAVWDDPITLSEHNVDNSAGKILRSLSPVLTGTAQGSGTGSNQIELAAEASSTDGAYDPSKISIISGTGVGQSRLILQYDGSTKIATVDRNWKVAPDNTSEYSIIGDYGREHVHEGLCQTAATQTITLGTLAGGSNDIYKYQLIFIRSGPGDDQVRLITAYNGTTKVATVSEPWSQIPDSTSAYAILPAHIHDMSEIVDAVWDEATADHTTDGSYGEELATKADIAAASSTAQNYAISGTVVYGTVLSGTYASLTSRDNTYWQIEEDGTNGITIEATFNLPSVDHRAGTVNIFGRYEGLPATVHYIDLFAYNYETSSWEQLQETFMPGGNTSDDTFSHEYFERHIARSNSNEVKIRLVHNVTTYNATHDIFLDYMDVSSIEVITAADIADAVWDEPIADHTSVGTTGLTVQKILGMTLENHVEDDIVRDASGNKTSSIIYCYNSASNATTHDKLTGITAKYVVTGNFDANNRVTSFSVILQ